MPSRGIAISAYSAPFSKGAKIYGENIQSGVVTSAHIADGTVVAGEVGAGAITSAKIGTDAVVAVKIAAGAVTSAKIGTAAVTNAKMKAAFLSGTLVSGYAVRAVSHTLGVKPKSVVVCALLTKAQLEASSARVRNVSVAAASAATSANIYLVGTQPANEAIKYAAYIQI